MSSHEQMLQFISSAVQCQEPLAYRERTTGVSVPQVWIYWYRDDIDLRLLERSVSGKGVRAEGKGKAGGAQREDIRVYKWR